MELKFRPEFKNVKEYIYDKHGRIKGKLEAMSEENRKLKPDELPSPIDDNIFKIAFGREDTKEYACFLFSTILANDLDFLIENMKFYKNELDKKRIKNRRELSDINFICDDVFFSFEMNNTNELERNQEIVHRLYAAYSNIGKRKPKYSKVIQFNINNFRLGEIEDTIDISMREGNKYRRSKIIYVDIYLPLIKKKYDLGEEMSYAERMILSMFIAKISDAKKLGGDEEMIKKFIRMLKRLKKDEDLMDTYYYENSRVTAGRLQGIEEGMEKGLEQGREEGVEQTAINMLKDGMSPDVVQKYTKLSPSKIKNIMTML